jgi:hypothetical protein
VVVLNWSVLDALTETINKEEVNLCKTTNVRYLML